MWTTVSGAARFRFECGWEDVIAMHGSGVDLGARLFCEQRMVDRMP